MGAEWLRRVVLQWLQKLVHIWQPFPCKANCGSNNKAKLVRIFCSKAKHCGPVCTKCQNISFMYWFNTGFTMTTTWWTSFCALPKNWVCHRYHMTKPSISCKYVSITYIGPTSIITPLINMSTVSNQTILTLLQNGYSWHKVAPQTHVSHSTARDTTLSSVTPSPGSVVGTQPGILLKAKNPLFTKSDLEQPTLPLNSRKLWTWVFVSILLRTHWSKRG